MCRPPALAVVVAVPVPGAAAASATGARLLPRATRPGPGCSAVHRVVPTSVSSRNPSCLYSGFVKLDRFDWISRTGVFKLQLFSPEQYPIALKGYI